MEDKEWNNIKDRLPKTHNWNYNKAIRIKKRSIANGDLILRIRKDWEVEGSSLTWINRKEISVPKIIGKEKNIFIISVYNAGNWKKIEKIIKVKANERKGDIVIIVGDFNARIGEEEGNEKEGWEVGRKNKDKKKNKKGRKFIELIEEIGEHILNETTKGDKAGEFTYVGLRESSVIDYI